MSHTHDTQTFARSDVTNLAVMTGLFGDWADPAGGLLVYWTWARNAAS